ncbi:MAG: histidine phosphatase family protein [Candidatus Lokiarchaeota archaeon]|nr:histidine phosphatase family protein [Candidatus Lokiarchaeota archaeon]
MIRITYFTHGTSIHNEKGLAAGWLPSELSQIGINQSIELGKIVSKLKFDAVFCSDLKRAIDTAKLAFKDKYQIIPDRRLREINFGEFTNKPIKSFRSEMIKYIQKPFPNGESYLDVEKRIKNLLSFFKHEYSGKYLGIIAHQAPQLAIEVLLKGKTWQRAIVDDWRINGNWQPGWEYFIKD